MIRAPQPLPMHLTQEEILAALAALSRLDWKRINRAASLLALKLANWTGPMLWSEAIWSALEGNRKWPRHVAAIPFIVMAMRSHVTNARKKVQDFEFLDASVADPSVSPLEIIEQEETERQLRQKISVAFAHHPNAQAVALGRVDGLRGDALQAFTGLDGISFASASRAIKRELEKRRP